MDPSINSLLTSWMLDDLSYFMLLNEITYEEFINLSKSKIDSIVPDSHSTSRNKLNNVLVLYRKTLNPQKPVLADVSNLNQNASSNDCYYETSKVPTERDKFKDYQDFYTQSNFYSKFLSLSLLKFAHYLLMIFSHILIHSTKNKRIYKLLHHADCLWGSIILYTYAYQGNISSLRDDLSKILVDAELDKTKESTLPFHIPSKVFQSLSQEIVDFFPCEEEKGNYKMLIQQGEVTSKKKTNLLINLHPQVTQVKTDTPIFTASETLLDINCLLNKPEDLSDSEKYHIIENWMTSYSYRKQTYTEKGLDLIKKLKVLETDLAYQLISYDFKKTFDETENFHKNLLTEWAQSAEFLVQYAKSLSENTVKFDIPELNGNYIKVDYSNLDDVFLKIKISTDGNRVADTLAFLILPALIKHTFRSNQSSGTWKITKEKSTDSFMQHIKDHESLDTINKDYSKFLQSHSVQEPQPYVVCCGPLDALTCVHAVVGDIVYDFTTATEAVDFLYKTLRVLDIQYPTGCPHVWSYFQLIFKQKDRRVIAKNKCLELDANIKELKNKRQRTK
ncbi:hypothetical protein TKK_0013744 [Trichogramma kaykai]